MIVTADDFGLSVDVNHAVAEAFARGVVTQTSAMANMPAFDAACQLARERGFESRVGVHLVLTSGEPLTDAMRGCGRFCEGGVFKAWHRSDSALWLTPSERAAVRGEWAAQIDRCLAGGIAPAHLDSHQHVHTKRALGPIVRGLAASYGVSRVRLAHNCGPRADRVRGARRALFNFRLRRAGLAASRWLGGFDDAARLRASGAALDQFELVTHPVLRDGMVVDASRTDVPFEQLVRGLSAS